jgi:hypothetical protein
MLSAEVVELADAQRSGRCVRKDVRVQIPPPAPFIFNLDLRFRKRGFLYLYTVMLVKIL